MEYELSIPIWRWSIPITGSSTEQCGMCDGDGDVEITRSRRIDELHDSHIQALFEADMFRETGGEEQMEKTREMEQQMQQAHHGSPHPGQIPY